MDQLVRIDGPDGRPRGVGFLADHHGTLLTSHEAVDGLTGLVLCAPDGRTTTAGPDAVVPLPALGLALVRTEGLDGVRPLPLTVRDRTDAGTYVRIAAGCWREARVLTTTPVTYTAREGDSRLADALELAIGTAGRDALRPGGGATGGPVLDARTGAVLGVLGTALRSERADRGFAVPVRPAVASGRALAALLARNAATVPAYGADLNPAAVLELTGAVLTVDGPPLAEDVEPVERAAVARELTDFAEGPHPVLALTGPPGSGRTTQLAALAAGRHRGEHPAPALWLRGADLRGGDDSLADAAHRALRRAGVAVCAAEPGDLAPGRVARIAAGAGRPLLLLLDDPEEMPPALARRLPEWTRNTVAWLRGSGARLVTGCREEFWEEHAEHWARGVPDGAAPPRVRLAGFTPAEARLARARHGVPEGALAGRDARHPLALRLLADVRAALPGAPVHGPVDRHEVFAAHLDLMCLRVAVRLTAGDGLGGTAVRRLATRVAGQVHEAARRALGSGTGALDRRTFEALFPPGPAPARLGGGSGWASAVLVEGLLVPTGTGYRFAHTELADWLQGSHLDLEAALDVLVHRPRETAPAAVPHHRAGPVVQALLLLARRRGARLLAFRLRELADALDADPASWWAARLLSRTLLDGPDAAPYREVLRCLAGRVVAWRHGRRPVPADLGPAFWAALPLPAAERFALLRELVLADGDTGGEGERHLDTVARLLAAAPAAVQPHLTRWFEDERPLPATPHATVATAAQALLHTHRHGALDELTEALADSGHRRADELLAVLAEDEPAAACRAADRWASDERPACRAAATALALRAAPHARTPDDRALLRRAARALLARPADRDLHGGALALLVRDPHTREEHLTETLRRFADGDLGIPAAALLPALDTDPEPVLDAFRARLRGGGPDTARTLRALADVTAPALVHRVATLVRETVAPGPDSAEGADSAGCVAAYVGRRLGQGPTARSELLPLVSGLLATGTEPVRAALAAVLATPGGPAARPLRRELLDLLLAHEQDPAVLLAAARAAVRHLGDGDDGGGEGGAGDGGGDAEAEARGLLHRTGLLCGRTPEGAARFDTCLADLAEEVPGLAARLARWLTEAPGDWAGVPGPGARRAIESVAGTRVPV
ncbi:trypsin-like peptidase domain-containing protein [Streptomyces sp. NPDC005435]|uniref:trypsin-like peptidase domain-containing protein n=1 Tax=Streptomyces sp. NPDC005435 TaxID=3154464 RepID=UPI003454FF09